jgi:hypothetical protein
MKIRLTQPGFDTYTGQMGTTFFVDGLSTADVRPQDAVRLAAQFLCEWEDGTTASVAQSLLDHSHSNLSNMPREINADEALAMIINANQAQESAFAMAAKKYGRAELEDIADKQGIKGLRAIGDAIGVKNNSVTGLIDDILAKQG